MSSTNHSVGRCRPAFQRVYLNVDGARENCDAARAKDAPVCEDERTTGIVDLLLASGPGELANRLVDREHDRRLPRSSTRQEAAVRVDGQDVGLVLEDAIVLLVDPLPALALLGEAHALDCSQEADGETVVQPEKVDLVRAELGLAVCASCGALAREERLVDDGRRIERATCFSPGEHHDIACSAVALVKKVALLKEAAAGHDDGRGSVHAPRALEQVELRGDLRRVEDVVERMAVASHRDRVLGSLVGH
mmetsp:Transcript_12861/g.41066  ORF Transcript_12861/g.41066 Transcript_12861/m.41066 type:complete len:250 (+) Transcript_12861:266-1015(+)